jgi:hypothetical protein
VDSADPLKIALAPTALVPCSAHPAPDPQQRRRGWVARARAEHPRIQPGLAWPGVSSALAAAFARRRRCTERHRWCGLGRGRLGWRSGDLPAWAP